MPKNEQESDYIVTYEAMVKYPKPETEAQRKLQVAMKQPQPMFSFIVHRIKDKHD